MKKLVIAGLVSGVVAVLFAGTALAEDGKKGSITGELVDMACYFKMGSKGGDHQKCAIKCAKSGIPVGVLDEKSGKVYTITVAASTLASAMAKTARVTGEVFEDSHAIVPKKVEVKGEDGEWTEVKLSAME